MDIEAVATEGGIAYIEALVYDPEEAVVLITFLHNPGQVLPEVSGQAEWSEVRDFTSTLHDEADQAEFEAGLWLEDLIGIDELPADGGRTVCVLTHIREVVFVAEEPPRWIPFVRGEQH